MINLESYAEIVGQDVIEHLHQLAERLKGVKVIHVNSTREGGGVAEILRRLVPLMQELGLEVSWEVITGDPRFFHCTKTMHNALQGKRVGISAQEIAHYEEINQKNAVLLCPRLEEADVVFVHDPQPAALIKFCSNRKGKWIWRCHIDISKPYRPVWKYLRQFVVSYDASVFHLADFAQPLPHLQFLIPPSIDPLSEKNIELSSEEIRETYERFGVDLERPITLQVSRFDRFKDPIGVIEAYKLAKKFIPSLQLVLAGGGAQDDPEGQIVLEEVKQVSQGDPDIHVLFLPANAHRTVNALQRGADIVLQKSIKEGFGLTVTEAMWKEKPVIGGNAGGIRLQVVNHHTGFLVSTPEGAALRMRYLFQNPHKRRQMGEKAKKFVLENFLITRHLRDYLTLMVSLLYNVEERIELG